jgi:hypothetical protein
MAKPPKSTKGQSRPPVPVSASQVEGTAQESKKDHKRKRDKNDEGSQDKTTRSEKSKKNGEEMEVDAEVPVDDGVEIIIDTTEPEDFPTDGWTLKTPPLPQFYDDWERPFSKMDKRLLNEGLSRAERVAEIIELFKGRSTRTVLATIWGNDFTELHGIQEASNKVLGYVPSMKRLEEGNTWCLLRTRSAEDAEALLTQHTVWKEGTAEMVIYRRLTWQPHATRILVVLNIPEESHVPWIMELLKKPWNGDPQPYPDNAN